MLTFAEWWFTVGIPMSFANPTFVVGVEHYLRVKQMCEGAWDAAQNNLRPFESWRDEVLRDGWDWRAGALWDFHGDLGYDKASEAQLSIVALCRKAWNAVGEDAAERELGAWRAKNPAVAVATQRAF